MAFKRKTGMKRVIAAILALTMAAEPVGAYLPGSLLAYAEETQAMEAPQTDVSNTAQPDEDVSPASTQSTTQSASTQEQSTASTGQADALPAQSADAGTAAASGQTQNAAPATNNEDATATQSSVAAVDSAQTQTAAGSGAGSDDNLSGTDAADQDGNAKDAGSGSETAANETAEKINAERVSDENTDGENANAERANEENAIDGNVNDENANDENINDENTNGENANDKNANDKNANDDGVNDENANAEDAEDINAENENGDHEAAEGKNADKDYSDLDLSVLSLEELSELAQERFEETTESVPMTENVLIQTPPVVLADSGSTALGASPSDSSSMPALLSEVEAALSKAAAASGKLTGVVTVVLKKNALYEGDVTISAGDRDVAGDFSLVLTAEDAGESGMEGDGATIINSNIIIQGIKVIMNSVMMGSDKTITVKNAGDTTTIDSNKTRAGVLEYNGTKNAMNNVTVKVGSKSSAVVTALDNDDTINVEMGADAESVKVDAGDGLNFVNARIYGGVLDIMTGSGNDTVSVDMEGGAKKVTVDTGDSYDELSVINNAGNVDATFNTGGGDDVIELDMRSEGSSMTVNTGGGGDTINVYKGDHFSIENLDYSARNTVQEIKNFASSAVLSIVNGDSAAVDRATVDVTVGDAIKGIVFSGGKGTSVHLKGSLLAGTDTNYNPIRRDTANENKLIFTVSKDEGSAAREYTLEITGDANTNYTDALKNKRTVYLDSTDARKVNDKSYSFNLGSAEDFTDYVVRMPVSGLDSLQFVTAGEKALLLSNVVLDTDKTLDEDDHLTVKDVSAQKLNLLLKGGTIEINGKVMAQNVRAEAVRGSHLFAEMLDEVMNNGAGITQNIFSIKDGVNINFGSNADVQAAYDIAALARVKHVGGILSGLLSLVPASVNPVNIKIADAHVTIENGARLTANKGSVDAQAKIETTTGYEYEYDAEGHIKANTDGSLQQKKDGFPVATTFIFNDASVTVKDGALIRAAEDILLRASSTVKALTYADTGLLASAALATDGAIGLTVISNQVSVNAAGDLKAGRKVYESASGSVSDDTNASRSNTSNATSGAFIAVNVVDQDVAAQIAGTAKAEAGGDVSVNSSAIADVKTSAQAAAGKQNEESSGIGAAAGGFLGSVGKGLLNVTILPLWNNLKEYLETKEWGANIAEKSRMKKLDELLNSVAGGNYSAKVIEPDPENAKKGSATVKTEQQEITHDNADGNNGNQNQDGNNQNNQNHTGTNSKVKARATVTVTPAAGCSVKNVEFRYLKAGDDKYTWGAASKKEGSENEYEFDMPAADVEVVVTYAGEPNGENVQNNNGGNEENADPDDLDLGSLFDQSDEIIEKDADEEKDLYSFNKEDFAGAKSYELAFDAKMTGGKVVTWLNRDNAEGSRENGTSLKKIYAGQKVLFVPNPADGKEIDTLTVKYMVKLTTGDEVERTDTVAADSKGRYVFTVPTELDEGMTLMESKPFTVTATFKDKTDTNDAGDVQHNQVTGAVAVGVLLNDNSAVIEKNAAVTAGGEVSLFGLKRSVNQTDADGTAVTKDNSSSGGSSSDSEEKVHYTTETKYSTSGAGYAVLIESTIPGAVKGTMEYTDGATKCFPKFTFTDKAYADRVEAVYISYYSMLNASLSKGRRVTEKLEAQEDSDGNVYYQPSLTSFSVVDGSTLQVSFVFKDDNGSTADAEGSAASTTWLVRNPIEISVNAIAKKQSDGQLSTTRIGRVSSVGQEGTKYYFNVVSESRLGYTIDAKASDFGTGDKAKSNTEALFASWRDASGKICKAALTYDPGQNYWYFDVADGSLGIPVGAKVTINALFREDTRRIETKDNEDSKGSVSYSKSEAKASDQVNITVAAKDGYVATSVKVTWQGKALNDAAIKSREAEYKLDAFGKGQIDMPELAELAVLYVTPVYEEKTITLTAKGSAPGGAVSPEYVSVIGVSDAGKVAAGQTITVEAADKAKSEGLHVKEIILVYNGNQHKFSDGSSIEIPKAENISGALIEVNVTLEKAAVEIKKLEAELGTLTPSYSYVNPGETVQIKVTPKEGYRAKSGTVKVLITTKTGVKQIVMKHTGENRYSFDMPSGDEYKNATVTMSAEFEEGDDGVALSMGVAAAVGVNQTSNQVQIRGGQVTSGTGISLVGVSIGGKATTEAKAGYSSGKTGFAGGVAVQVSSVNTDVSIQKDDNGFITVKDGSLFLMANSKQEQAVTADASGKKDSNGKNTGVGAGIAVSVTKLRSVAEVEDDVRLGTATPTNLTSITITGGQKSKETVTAKAGAKGGTAIVPVAAVDVASITARGKLGKLAGVDGALNVSGKVKIKGTASSAKAAYNHLITADASAVSKGSALGAAFIVSWIDTTAEALLNQSIKAGKDIQIASSADDSVKAVAKAAVTGGMEGSKDSSGSGTADRQANGMLRGAANIAGSNGMNANRIKNDANQRQNAENSDNTVAGAGAFVLNVQSVHSLAEIRDGADVETAGKLSVTSANRTDATIKADASTTGSNTGVGVGIAINIVDMENIARIGNGGVTANELELTAKIAKAPANARVLTKVEGQSAFREQLEALLKDKLNELMGDNYFSSIIATVAAAGANELITALHLEKIFAIPDGDLGDLFANPINMIIKRLQQYPETLIAPLMTVVDEVSGTFEYFDEDRFKQILVGEITAQLPGYAVEVLKEMFKENKMTLLTSVFSMLGDGIGGNGWSGAKLTDQLKGVAKSALTKLGEQVLNNALRNFSTEVQFLTDNNVEMVKRAYKRMSGEGNLLGGAVEYAVETFRTEVYDYQALMVEIGEKGFVNYVKETLMNTIKASGVAFVNESLDALMSKMDVKVGKEPVSDRHIITTQAIAGAGAASSSGAGSLAIAVANLTTKAEIAAGTKAVNITGETVIDAEEKRRIRTHATAAVDEDGEADNNTSEGTGEASEIVGGSESGGEGSTVIEKKDAKNDLCIVTTAYGATSEFDKDGGVEKVWIKVADGYQVTGGTKATRTYKNSNEEEVTEELQIQKDGDKYYIRPYSDMVDAGVWSSDMNVSITGFEEILHTIPTPKAEGGNEQRDKIPDGVVTVSVKGREASDGKIRAKANDLVELTVKKVDGYELDSVLFSYEDENGNQQKVEKKVVDLTFGAASGRTYSNDEEEGYAFYMPNADVKEILVLYQRKNAGGGEEEENAVRDKAGRSIGVGAAFSLTYGNSDVIARIGRRNAGVTAGTLAVTASSEHDEENYATAGTEPFDGTDEDATKDTAIDASVSVNILDNDIRASIAEGTKVTVTGAGAASDPKNRPLGSLTVSAEEESSSETKASSFATGSKTIVGAAVAVNLSLSDVNAELGSGAGAVSDVTVTADSASQDETWAFATALGADVQRALNKVAKGTKAAEEAAKKLTTGAYFDDAAKKWKNSGSKSNNKTSSKINDRLNKTKDKDGDEASGNLNLSTNVLRSQNVKQANGDDANNAVNEAQKKVNGDGGSYLGGNNVDSQTNPNENKKLQVAAAVGVMVTNHAAGVKVGDIITTGDGDVTISASNDGNFNTRSTGAAMSLEKRSSGSTIAAAVGVSVNNNKATVEVTGGVEADGDVTITSDMQQNQDEEFIKRVAVQSISGAVSGEGTGNSIAGSVSVLVSNAQSTVSVKGKESTKDWNLKGSKVTVSADDKSKLGIRAGGINVSTGASVGAGLSAAVLVSNNTVTAEVGDHARIEAGEFALTAVKRPVTWEDAVSPYSWSDLVTDTSALNDEQRENVYTGIIDVHRKPGEKSYSVDINLDSHNIMKAFDALNILSYKNYYVESIAGSIAAKRSGKFNGAGSISVVTTQNKVDAILGSHVTIDVVKPEETANPRSAQTPAASDPTNGDGQEETEKAPDGSVTILADGSTTARLISGAISGGKTKSGAGISVTYFGDSDHVHTTIGNGVIIGGEKIAIGTKADTDVESYNAAAAIVTGDTAKLALGGVIDVINMSNEGKTTIGEAASITSAGDLAVTSQADMDLILVSAGVAGGKSAAAGGAVTVIISGTKSAVEIAKNQRLKAQGDLEVSGRTTEKLLSVSASASAAASSDQKTSVAGSINVLVSKSKGTVDIKASDASNASNPYGLVAGGGSVSVRGEVATRAVNVTAGLSGSKGTAIGLSVNGNWFDQEAAAKIGGGAGYVISAGKDVLMNGYAENTTVLAGLAAAGSTSGSAIAGNLQLTRSGSEVSTILGQAQVSAGGEAAFASRVNDMTVSVAGSAALSNQQNGVGAAAVVLLKGNTITTDVGKSEITAKGNAGTLKNKVTSAPDFSGVYVGAAQKDLTVAVGAGVALAKEVGVSANIAFLRNASTIKADSSKASITATTGSIRQEAVVDTLEWVVAGGLGIGKTAGAGAAVSGIYGKKIVDSYAGNMHAAKDVAVSANNKDAIYSIGLSVGGGQLIAAQVGAVVQVLESEAHAIGYSGGVMKSDTGSVSVTAKNDARLLGVAASVTGSQNLVVSPVGTIMLFGGESQATVGGTVIAAKDIIIKATADKDIDQYTVGLAVAPGGFGISGAVNLIKAQDSVLANAAAGSTLTGKGTIHIEASGDYKAVAASASAAISTNLNASVNAMIHLLKGKVEAELAGNVGSAKDTAGNVRVVASSARDVVDAAAAISGSMGVLSAGATVMVFNAGDEKLSQDALDTLIYGNSGDSKGNNKKKTFELDKYLKKLEDQGIDTSSLSGFKEDLQGDGVKNSDTKINGVSDTIKKATTDNLTLPQRKATTPKDMVMARITSESAIYAGGDVTVRALQPSMIDLYSGEVAITLGEGAALGATVAVANLHSNVSASANASRMILNGGKVNVDASSTAASVKVNSSQSESARMASLSSQLADGSGNLWKNLDPTRRSIRVVGLAVNGGMLALGAAVGVLNTDNVTSAVLGGTVQNASETNVHADSIYDNILTAVLNVSLGIKGGSIGAAVAYAASQGETTAKIASNATIRGTTVVPKVSVTTDAVFNVSSAAAAAAGGGYAGANAGVAYVDNSLKQTTYIEGGAKIEGTSNSVKNKSTQVKVEANSTSNADTWLLAAQVNLIGNIQAGLAMSRVRPTIVTGIGTTGGTRSAINLAGADVSVINKVKSRGSSGAVILSGALVASLNGAILRSVNETVANAQIVNTNVNANTVTVSSAVDATGDSNTVNVNIGAISGAIANSKVELTAANQALIDTTGSTQFKAAKGITVDTGNKDTSKSVAKASSFSVEVGIASPGMNYAKTINKSANIARLTGSGKVETTQGAINVNAYSKATTETKVKPWAVGGLDVKVDDMASGEAINAATSLAEVTLTGDIMSDLKVHSDMDANTESSLIGGGLKLIEIFNSNAVAEGKTQSLVNVNLAKAGAMTHRVALDVQNKASDKVNSKLVTYTPIEAVKVALLDATADSKDTFDTQVKLGSGNFYFTDFNVVTDYDTDAQALADSGGAYVAISLFNYKDKTSVATNESYAGTTVTLDHSTVNTSKDVNVRTKGTANAKATAGTENAGVEVVTIGTAKAEAKLTAVQDARLVMADGALTTAGDLNVQSEYDKAHAEAQTGALVGEKTDYSGRISLLPVTPFTSIATEKLSSTAAVLGSGSLRSKINAKNVKINSGASKSGASKADALAKGSMDISLMSIGNLDATSSVAEKIYTAVDGVGITASGKADITASADTTSNAKVLVPKFNLSIISDFRDLEAEASIGADKDRQVVQTLIGDGTSIKAKGGDLTITAKNKASAETGLQKGSIGLITDAMDYEEHTKEYFDTGVQIGRNVALSADKGAISVLSQTMPTAKSDISTWNAALIVTTSDSLGNITIREKNTLSIGDDSSLEASKDVHIKADTNADSVAVADFTGITLGAEVNKVKAKNDISRTVDLTVGRGTSVTSNNGAVTLESLAGTSDHIETKAKIKGISVLNSDPESHATTSLTSLCTLRIGERAEITAKKDVNLLATSTSVNAGGSGINSEAVTKGGSAFPFPDATSTVNLSVESLVYVNRGRSTGVSTVKSTDGNVKLRASNEGMRIRAYANADNDGGAGNSEATAKISGDVFNQVWTDNAVYSGKKVTFLATNGENVKPYIFVNSLAEFYGAGATADSTARIDGTWSNYVSTYNKAKVTVTGSFTHTATSPSSAVTFRLDADAEAWLKTHKYKEDKYTVRSHCDFCADPTETDNKNSRKIEDQDRVKSVERVNGVVSDLGVYEQISRTLDAYFGYADAASGNIQKAFEKALVNLADIRKLIETANKGTGVTKARYGEEDYRTAGRIFVLDLAVLLAKDVRLASGGIDRYRMWTNSATQMDIYLLPNSSRLAMGAGMRLGYVTDTLRGDALGDGTVYDIDIITALTDYAFTHPVIAIGSSGSLDFSDGTLQIPAESDLDLYLHEISAKWLLTNLEEKTIRVISSGQSEINACAMEEEALPQGEILEGITPAGSVQTQAGKDGGTAEWQMYWAGYTPQSAPDEDTPLYYLLVNEQTDEADAYRTSLRMIREGEEAADVSLYIFRDSEMDRRGEIRYDLMFFDTPREELSLVKAVSGLLESREMEVPRSLQIVLRIFYLDGADLPAYSISGHLFAMNDGTDGAVAMFDGFYLAAFDGDTFESDYLKVEGIADSAPAFTIKAGQPIWPEWTSDETAEDIAGVRYRLTGDGWEIDAQDEETSRGSAA